MSICRSTSSCAGCVFFAFVYISLAVISYTGGGFYGHLNSLWQRVCPVVSMYESVSRCQLLTVTVCSTVLTVAINDC